MGFLEEWETEANVVDLTASEREKLHLSRQTLEGIRMTGIHVLHLTRLTCWEKEQCIKSGLHIMSQSDSKICV